MIGSYQEHIVPAGRTLVSLLCNLYSAILDVEYVPECLRIGVHVPLFKGKNLCPLDPNSYCGITLLSMFNTILEILVWQRLKAWWSQIKVISGMQWDC